MGFPLKREMCIRDSFYGASAVKTLNYGLKKEFLDRYDVDEVLRENHLTAEQIAADVMALL